MAFNLVGWGKGFDPTFHMLDQWFPSLDPAPPGDTQPMPTAPGYTPLYSQQQLDSIPVDLSGINAYRQEAERTGPSGWANLEHTANAAQEANQNEQAQQTAAGQTAAAQNSLASSGGLSSGARERATEGGATNYLDMSQNLQRQGNLNDLQVGINDEQNRIQQLGALPGMESQAIQPLMQKAQMVGANNQAANQYNQNLYDQQMQQYASGQTANAIQNSGGNGPSYICTALAKQGLLRPGEAKKMFWFGVQSFLERADFTLWYLKYARKAVEVAKAEGLTFDENAKVSFIDLPLAFLKTGNVVAAQNQYMVATFAFVEYVLGKENAHVDRNLLVPSKWRALKAIPQILKFGDTYEWVLKILKNSKKEFVSGH